MSEEQAQIQRLRCVVSTNQLQWFTRYEVGVCLNRIAELEAALSLIERLATVYADSTAMDIALAHCKKHARKALEKDNGETPRKTVAQVAKEWGEKPINKYIDTELVDPVFAKGYAQGLEDAAKRIENMMPDFCKGFLSTNELAPAIRALQKEGK